MLRLVFPLILSLFAVPLSRTTTPPPPAPQVLEIATGEYAPLTGEAFDDGGPVTAIVSTVLERMKKNVKVVYVPWKRADDGVRKGHYWAAFPYVKSADREKTFLFSAPLIKTPTRFFVRKDSPSSMEPASWWKGKILCRPAGYEATLLRPFIEKYQLQIEQPLTLESCYMMLKAKKVDLIPNPEIVGQYYIQKLFGSDEAFKTLNDMYHDQTFHVIVNREAPGAMAFMNEFDRILHQMYASGEYTRIYNRSAERVKKSAGKGRS